MSSPRIRHALFVCFHYPPEASSSGVLRTLKYSRYLPEMGWRVSVIAPDVAAYVIRDENLVRQVPPGTRVVRTRYLNTKQHLAIRGIYPALLALPDSWIGWMPWAVAAGRRLIGDDPVDLVYSTSPHATAHVIAMRLAGSANLPWVTDFRDPWIEEPPEPGTPAGPIFLGINRWLERRVVRRASLVTTSTTHLQTMLAQRYPDIPPTKIQAILNGYDEADFADVRIERRARAARLRIVHAGSIHPDFRDPRPLFEAIERLTRTGKLRADEVELRFLGGGPFGESPEMQAVVNATGLAGSVAFVPRVPYEESLRELAGADLLLLLQASDDTVGLVPAKLYEYLRAQKPTLALVRPGAVTEVLGVTGGGWAQDPGDAIGLDSAVAAIVDAWRADRLADSVADLAILRRFDRRALAAELAAAFDRVVSGS